MGCALALVSLIAFSVGLLFLKDYAFKRGWLKPSFKPAQTESADATSQRPVAAAIRSLTSVLVLGGLVAFAFLVPLQTCPNCNGIGKFIINCHSCDGQGKQTIWQIVKSSPSGRVESQQAQPPPSSPSPRKKKL